MHICLSVNKTFQQVLSGNILLNRSASPSHKRTAQDNTTFFRHHLISASVAASGTTKYLNKRMQKMHQVTGDSADPLDTGVNLIQLL